MDAEIPGEGRLGQQSQDASEHGCDHGQYSAEERLIESDTEPKRSLGGQCSRYQAISAEI